MHFGFALDSWNMDLWDIDLLDTDLDLLVGHGYIQISLVNILFVSKMSSRLLEHNNFSSSQTFSRCLERCLQDVFKMYLQDFLRWFGRQKIVTMKTC